MKVPQTDTFSLGRWIWFPSISYGLAPDCSLPSTSLCFSSLWVFGQFDQVTIVHELHQVISGSHCFEFTSVSDIRCRSDAWVLHDTGFDGFHYWRLTKIDCAVRVTPQEVNRAPTSTVVGFVWNVLLDHLFQQGWVAPRVKRLTEIERYDINDIWICEENVNNVVK